MASPKHLWSGDWERESAAAAAARGDAPPAPPEPSPTREQWVSSAPSPPPPPPPAPPPAAQSPPPPRAPTPPPPARPAQPQIPRPSPRERPEDARAARRLRVLVLSVLGGLILVGAVWALSSGGGGSTGTIAVNTRTSPGSYSYNELGLVLESVPVNRVIVQAVVPGSPADQAGIGASDELLSVNGHAVTSPDQVDGILAHISQGHTVTLQLDQGPAAMTVQIQLSGTTNVP